MRIESAIEQNYYLRIIIDGRHFVVGENYSFLEQGYASFLMDKGDEDWLRENGDTIPPDPSDSRREVRSGGSMLITADPVLVALSLESWWSRNGKPQPQGVQLPIPTMYEAIKIVRNREILNDFNRKYAGTVPGLELVIKKEKVK